MNVLNKIIHISSLAALITLNHSFPVMGNSLPCLDSSPGCVGQLTTAAIANSPKLKTLDDRIALIDKRLGVSADSIDYAESKLWTNYLPSSRGKGSEAATKCHSIARMSSEKAS